MSQSFPGPPRRTSITKSQLLQWYRRSPLPQCCLVCGNRRFELQNWTQDHQGNEDACDVIPLCHEHRQEYLGWLARTGDQSRQVNVHLVKCFGIGAKRAKSLFAPFARHRRDLIHKVRRCRTCGRHLSVGHKFGQCWSCAKRAVSGEQPVSPPLPQPGKKRTACVSCGHRHPEEAFDHSNHGQCDRCASRTKLSQLAALIPVRATVPKPEIGSPLTSLRSRLDNVLNKKRNPISATATSTAVSVPGNPRTDGSAE